MKRWSICLVAFGATTSAAVAEPVTLADADMDTVTAGGVPHLVPEIPLDFFDEFDAETWSQAFHDWGDDLVKNLKSLGQALAAETNGPAFILPGGTVTRTETVENGVTNWTFVVTETVGDRVINRGFVFTETVANGNVKRTMQRLDAP